MAVWSWIQPPPPGRYRVRPPPLRGRGDGAQQYSVDANTASQPKFGFFASPVWPCLRTLNVPLLAGKPCGGAVVDRRVARARTNRSTRSGTACKQALVVERIPKARYSVNSNASRRCPWGCGIIFDQRNRFLCAESARLRGGEVAARVWRATGSACSATRAHPAGDVAIPRCRTAEWLRSLLPPSLSRRRRDRNGFRVWLAEPTAR